MVGNGNGAQIRRRRLIGEVSDVYVCDPQAIGL